jgi:hypothetical protein
MWLKPPAMWRRSHRYGCAALSSTLVEFSRCQPISTSTFQLASNTRNSTPMPVQITHPVSTITMLLAIPPNCSGQHNPDRVLCLMDHEVANCVAALEMQQLIAAASIEARESVARIGPEQSSLYRPNKAQLRVQANLIEFGFLEPPPPAVPERPSVAVTETSVPPTPSASPRHRRTLFSRLNISMPSLSKRRRRNNLSSMGEQSAEGGPGFSRTARSSKLFRKRSGSAASALSSTASTECASGRADVGSSPFGPVERIILEDSPATSKEKPCETLQIPALDKKPDVICAEERKPQETPRTKSPDEYDVAAAPAAHTRKAQAPSPKFDLEHPDLLPWRRRSVASLPRPSYPSLCDGSSAVCQHLRRSASTIFLSSTNGDTLRLVTRPRIVARFNDVLGVVYDLLLVTTLIGCFLGFCVVRWVLRRRSA